MGFTKLDENLLQSSIMAEDGATFKVWIALLAACKENGIAPVSAIFLSSICRLTIEETIAAIKKLESPDALSRSTNDEGRRVERVDGGYFLINYHKYREFTVSGSKEAIRQRRHRDKERDTALHVTEPRDISASASISASSSESSPDSEQEGRTAENADNIFWHFWNVYPRKVSKGDAARAWKKIKCPLETLRLIEKALEWQKKSYNWTKDGGQYIPYPASYLNAAGWLDERREYTGPEKGSHFSPPAVRHEEYRAKKIAPEERAGPDFLAALRDQVEQKIGSKGE